MDFGTGNAGVLSALGNVKKEVTHNHHGTGSVNRDAILLQMYDEPPLDDLLLEDVVDFALRRLRGLRVIESCGLMRTKGSAEYHKLMEKELGGDETLKHWCRQSSVSGQVIPSGIKEFINWDITSHFILRLAFCKT